MKKIMIDSDTSIIKRIFCLIAIFIVALTLSSLKEDYFVWSLGSFLIFCLISITPKVQLGLFSGKEQEWLISSFFLIRVASFLWGMSNLVVVCFIGLQDSFLLLMLEAFNLALSQMIMTWAVAILSIELIRPTIFKK